MQSGFWLNICCDSFLTNPVLHEALRCKFEIINSSQFSDVMSLGRRYVQYVNRTYRRTGTAWDGRHKSLLIDADSYLLSCMRYSVLNPVREVMVDDPAHNRWTRYRSNALGQDNECLTPHQSQSGGNR